MSKHYTVAAFFREMPGALLGRYFEGRAALQEFDFKSLAGANRDALLAAWIELPDSQRHRMDADFQEIFALSNDVGTKAAIDEAAWHLREQSDALQGFVEQFSSLPNHAERAMTLFLDYQQFWKGATLFHHADTLPYWRKRKGLGHRPAAVDEASVGQLASLIRLHFHAEGRGNHCKVECYRRGERDYFYAYPEDYSRQSVEWVGDTFAPRPHNPALEVVFLYHQREGTLDLNVRGGARKQVETLQGIFATAILKMDGLPPDPKDERVYELGNLLRPEFALSFSPESGIRDVWPRLIRLSHCTGSGERITLEAKSREELYALLQSVGKSLPLHLYNVTQVELLAEVAMQAGKPAKNVPIRITHPNSCSLKYDEVGLKLRAMLGGNGIEPRQPAKAAVD